MRDEVGDPNRDSLETVGSYPGFTYSRGNHAGMHLTNFESLLQPYAL